MRNPTDAASVSATGPIAFAGSPIDRADLIRVDPDALAARMDWRAKVLLLDGVLPQIDDTGGLVWGTLADVPQEAELVFLGLMDEKACFAAVPDDGATGPAYAMPRAWQAIQQLSPPDLAIYGGARSLVDWHARHRFCARCGSPTKPAKGGWQRNCAPEGEGGCGAQHFSAYRSGHHHARGTRRKTAAWPTAPFSAARLLRARRLCGAG